MQLQEISTHSAFWQCTIDAILHSLLNAFSMHSFLNESSTLLQVPGEVMYMRPTLKLVLRPWFHLRFE